MSQLTDKVKAKYPQYANVPDAQLEQKVLAKYPQYKPLASKPAGGFIKSIVQPFINTGKNIGGAGYELYRAGKSALGDQNAYVNQQTGKTVQNPFLNEEELTKVSQPLSLSKGSALRQQVGDSANIASYAVPFGKGANVATKALIPGAAVGALNSATADASFSDVAKGAAGGALFAGAAYGAGKLVKKVPNAFRKQSEQVITRGIGNPVKQADIAKKSGKTMGQFLKEYNILDRSPDTATDVKKAIINQYDDLALRSGKDLPVGGIVTKIDNEIATLQGGAGKFSDANQAKIEELIRRKQQFLESAGADATKSPLTIPVKDTTLFRREALDPDIPKSMFNLDAKGTGKAQGAKATRDILRDAINSSDPRLKQLGLDYGMAKGIEDILTKAQSRGQNRQMFNFTKLGSAGIGSVLYGAPGVVAGFAAEQLVNHPVFIRALSSALSSGAVGQEAVNRVLANPQVQQVVLQLASRAGSGASRLGQKTSSTGPSPKSKRTQSKTQSYPSSITGGDVKKTVPTVTKEITYKPPKNIFKNKSAFGKSFRLKAK